MAERLRLTIDADASQVARELARARSELRRTATEAQRASAAGVRQARAAQAQAAAASASAVRLRGLAAQFRAGTVAGEGMRAMLDRQRQTLGEVASAATRAAQAVGLASAAMGALALKTGLEFNARMEQNQVALEQFLGSAGRARQMLDQLFEIAKKTPFEFADVTEAARKFLAFGFSAGETVKTLRAVGDAVAALGGSAEMIDRVVIALGQIRAKGRVQGDELLQLAEAGIPAYQILAEKLQLTAAEVKNIGSQGISADRAIRALVAGMEERFGGATERQARTMAGQISTLKDNVRQTLGAVTQDLFAVARDRWVPAMNRAAEQIAAIWRRRDLTPEEKLRESWPLVRAALEPMVRDIARVIDRADIPRRFGEALGKTVAWVASHAPEIAARAVRAFVEAFTASNEWGKLVLGAWLASKLGLVAGMRAAGRRAGVALIEGIVAGAAISGAAGAAGAAGGGAAGAAAGGAAAGGLAARLAARWAPALRIVGKRFLWGAILLGILDGATSKGPLDVKLQNALNSMTMGLVPRARQSAAQFGRAFADAAQRVQLQMERLRGSLIGQWRDVQQAAASALTIAVRELGARGREASRLAGAVWGQVGEKIGLGLRMGQLNVQRAMRVIEGVVRRTSGRARAVAVANMMALASGIAKAMQGAGKASAQGMAVILALVRQALRALGGTGAGRALAQIGRAMSVMPGALGQIGQLGALTMGALTRQRGGFVVGDPRAAGRDTVPITVAGRPVMVARGETVAVINRHQREVIDTALAATFGAGGGLNELFRRVRQPHALPSARRPVERMQQGGWVGASPAGLNPAIRQIALWAMRRYQAVATSTTGGRHAPGSLHYQGAAVDLVSPNMRAMAAGVGTTYLRSLAELFHDPLGWFVKWGRRVPGAIGGHSDHVHAAAVGGVVPMTLPRILVRGPAGSALREVAQQAINRTREMGLRALERLAAAFAPDMPGGADARRNMEIARGLAQRFGWASGAQWAALVELWRRESGWSATARNPQSGAYGIPQALPPSKMASAGPDWRTNPATQILWGLRYIQERYGSPVAALRWHDQHGWYQRGGLVDARRLPPSRVAEQLQARRVEEARQRYVRERSRRALAALRREREKLAGIRRRRSAGERARSRRAQQLHEWVRGWDITDQPVSEAQRRIEDEEARLENWQRQAEVTVDPETGEPGIDRGEAQHLIGWHQRVAAMIGGWPTFGGGGLAELARSLLGRMLQAGARARERLAKWREQVRRQVARRRQLRERIERLRKRLQEIERAAEKARRLRDQIRDLEGKRRLSSGDRRRLGRLRGELAEQLRIIGPPHEADRLRRELELSRREYEQLGASNITLAGEADPGSSEPGRVAADSVIGSTGTVLENLRERAERVGDLLRPGGLEQQWVSHRVAAEQLMEELRQRGEKAMQQADTSGAAEEISQLLQQELDRTQRQLRVVTAQFRALSDVLPLLTQQAGILGRFAHGGVVPETGLYLLHRDERVVPDPQGPYGSQLAGGRPVEVTVVVDGDASPLLRNIEVMVDGKLQEARIRQGRASRLIRNAPGGGGVF